MGDTVGEHEAIHIEGTSGRREGNGIPGRRGTQILGSLLPLDCRPSRAVFPPPGFLCPVPVSDPGCEHPSDSSAVHMPGPDPAHRVVGGLPVHPVCHVQAGAGAGALPAGLGAGRPPQSVAWTECSCSVAIIVWGEKRAM